MPTHSSWPVHRPGCVAGTRNGALRDLMTAAQTVVVNGTITGDVRMAGSVLFVGEKAVIGGDLLGGGYSLEVRKGSTVGRDAVVPAGVHPTLSAHIAKAVSSRAVRIELHFTTVSAAPAVRIP